MPSDSEEIIGKRVRLLPDAYVRLVLLLPNGCTGTIEAKKLFEQGNRTEYLFLADKQFHVPEEETEFYVREEEIEQC
jgi:hypothetical protein